MVYIVLFSASFNTFFLSIKTKKNLVKMKTHFPGDSVSHTVFYCEPCGII